MSYKTSLLECPSLSCSKLLMNHTFSRNHTEIILKDPPNEHVGPKCKTTANIQREAMYQPNRGSTAETRCSEVIRSQLQDQLPTNTLSPSAAALFAFKTKIINKMA